MSIAGQGILVLNSNRVAVDLLDRRGAIYSDRPRFIGQFFHQCPPSILPRLNFRGLVANEIFTGGLMIAMAKFGEVCVQVSSVALA